MTIQPKEITRIVQSALTQLDMQGFAVTSEALLAPEECADLRETFEQDQLFRSSVDLARYRFGEGRYRYFADPLPALVHGLREHAYGPLAGLANEWGRRLAVGESYPSSLVEFLAVCARSGQTKPTPLILRYERGGWNALHQDIYGRAWFPFQLTVALTTAGQDFSGGENLFIEQRPRQQSRGFSVTVPLGHAVIFPSRHRPLAGSRGYYRATVKHGVSTITAGLRYTLGIIFHNAE
jgi:uncharacterized protein